MVDRTEDSIDSLPITSGHARGEAVVPIMFYDFSIGDVDDVDIYAAQPIYEWQQTDHGRWVMAHAQDLRYYTQPDMNTFGYRVVIRGMLEPQQATEYFLRWHNAS